MSPTAGCFGSFLTKAHLKMIQLTNRTINAYFIIDNLSIIQCVNLKEKHMVT